MPKKPRREEYLDALRADPDHEPRSACKAVGWRMQTLYQQRMDAGFAEQEAALLEKLAPSPLVNSLRDTQVRIAREEYLEALEARFGNEVAARRDCSISTSRLDEWRRDPEFQHAEQEVYAGLCGRLEEESMRVALGEEPKTRDSGHLRWKMERLMRDKYGEKAKRVEVTHTGKLTLEAIEREIAELEDGREKP